MFQSLQPGAAYSAEENVLLPLQYQGRVKNMQAMAVEALEMVGLSGRLRHNPAEMSGGEKQRVAICARPGDQPAIILQMNPPVTWIALRQADYGVILQHITGRAAR